MPIEHLRILRECAGFLRTHPEDEFLRERRDEWLEPALEHHPASEVAESAGMSIEELTSVVVKRVDEARATHPFRLPQAIGAGLETAIHRRMPIQAHVAGPAHPGRARKASRRGPGV